MARSFKKETAIDKKGSRKFRPYPADQERAPKPHSREKVWVGGHKRKGGVDVKGHFRKAPRRKRR